LYLFKSRINVDFQSQGKNVTTNVRDN